MLAADFAEIGRMGGSVIQIPKLIICFALYSITGWIYETVICSISERKLVKRGFLHGPYCPIYGVGAIICIVLFSGINNTLALFAAGMVVTSVVEYFTSWAMEKLFYARWWDYSERRFNLNGRICLLGAVVFGTMTVLLIRLIHPIVYSVVRKIDTTLCTVIACVFSILFITDIIFTVIHINALNGKLRELRVQAETALTEYKIRAKEKAGGLRINLSNDLKTHVEKIKLNTKSLRITLRDRRIFRGFPHFISTKYGSELAEFKNEWRLRLSQKHSGKENKK